MHNYVLFSPLETSLNMAICDKSLINLNWLLTQIDYVSKQINSFQVQDDVQCKSNKKVYNKPDNNVWIKP